MMLSGTAQYAIRAVLHVAAHGTEVPVRVSSIARTLRVPQNYLSKTLHVLARNGVLRSVRGPRGGFLLAAPPGRLTLARIAAPFDDVGTRRCVLGWPSCTSHDACPLHARWEALSGELRAFFIRTTISDLLASGQLPDAVSAAPRRASRKPRGG